MASQSEIDTALLVAPGQTILLHLCIATGKASKDQDVAIWEILPDPGVHTGCLPDQPILDSGVWPLRNAEDTT